MSEQQMRADELTPVEKFAERVKRSMGSVLLEREMLGWMQFQDGRISDLEHQLAAQRASGEHIEGTLGMVSGGRNQCDGCVSGAALDGEMHRNADGSPMMVCQRHRYASGERTGKESLQVGGEPLCPACVNSGRRAEPMQLQRVCENCGHRQCASISEAALRESGGWAGRVELPADAYAALLALQGERSISETISDALARALRCQSRHL